MGCAGGRRRPSCDREVRNRRSCEGSGSPSLVHGSALEAEREDPYLKSTKQETPLALELIAAVDDELSRWARD